MRMRVRLRGLDTTHLDPNRGVTLPLGTDRRDGMRFVMTPLPSFSVGPSEAGSVAALTTLQPGL